MRSHDRDVSADVAPDISADLRRSDSFFFFELDLHSLYTMATVIATPLGAAIPQHLSHAISVSLPTWQDNVDYEEGRPRVVDAMVNGYPRFFINKSIQKASP